MVSKNEYQFIFLITLFFRVDTESNKIWKVLFDYYKKCRWMHQIASRIAAEVPKKRWRYLDVIFR